MIIFLLVIIGILSGVIIFQHLSKRERNKNLKYIEDKLQELTSKGKIEKILVVKDDERIKGLLLEINNLLDYSQKVLADYRKKEISMRKMLSNISHDLKTPLTVVLGYIETISLDNNMEIEEREELLSKVHNKTLEVIDLMNKFFDLAKLESGDKDIPITRVNMNEICRKNILDFYDILNNKGIEVNINIPEEIIYSQGNDEALDRIVNNLISNAIRYGMDGNYLEFNLRFDDEYSYIEVIDKGKGIDENQIENVFERMYTLEDSRNKLFQGSGLGLTITKRLVEKLGGEIYLKSKPNLKTIFTVKLKRITY
ncbi:sensor histidine kinase [Clostridium sp. 'White wine YQ']|uniref:sensor histidine kinase n=1 Tax=Clostridium sp. 'White wine YQ' TaxID=3027474 RepID=UPI002366A5EF|nr:sensor histidine kinase [Clostridium sp. 'White wine YQ']MDD7794212.1 sensor histidine kinase [Clostridium sp. 'White wine YQ']